MTSRAIAVLVAAAGFFLASPATAGDCFNDEVPASNDLEPPAPGSAADLLRVTDSDVEQMLQKLAAYERERREGAPSARRTVTPR